MKLTPVGDTVCDVLDTRGIKVICLEQGLRSLTDMDCRAVSFLKENRCHTTLLVAPDPPLVTGHRCLLVTTARELVTDVDSELAELPPVLPGCVGGGAGAWPGLPGLILPIIGERRHGAQQISAYVHKYMGHSTVIVHRQNF